MLNIETMQTIKKKKKKIQAREVLFVFTLRNTPFCVFILCMCIFCLLVCLVLIKCYPGRDSGLNGISLFQQFKHKGVIQNIHSLIPFHSFRCDIHTVCKIHFLQNAQKMCKFVCVIPCLLLMPFMREGLHFYNTAQ